MTWLGLWRATALTRSALRRRSTSCESSATCSTCWLASRRESARPGRLLAPSTSNFTIQVLRGLAPGPRSSEWNVVVEVVVHGRRRRCRLATAVVAAAVARCLALATATTLPGTTAVPAAAAVEHLHVVGDDLGGVALHAVLFPAAGLQAAFNVDLRALPDVFGNNLGEALVEHHAVPLGALLLLAGVLVLPGFAGGQGEVGDGAAIGHVAGFGILSHVPHQNYFVDTSASHSDLPTQGYLYDLIGLFWRITRRGRYRRPAAEGLGSLADFSQDGLHASTDSCFVPGVRHAREGGWGV